MIALLSQSFEPAKTIAIQVTGQRRLRQKAKSRRGAMLILIVVMLMGFMATVAFSVDIAQMHLARTELRTATDAAAKAASIELSRSLDEGQAIQAGTDIAAQNRVQGEPLLLSRSDFVFGRSAPDASGRFLFTQGDRPTNSVRVNGRRTAGSRSGPIPLLFGNVLEFSEFEPEKIASATYIERDIVLVVDRSGSMRGKKFRDLISAIQVFTSTLNSTPVDEKVGLASYSSFSSEDVQLTTNMNAIQNRIGRLPVSGLTSISRGMEAGRSIMLRSRDANFVERTMIVMTDGKHNRGPEPRSVAQSLAGDRVQIHTITFGSKADQNRMREVAAIGRGRHFHAPSAARLREVYREIALTLSTKITQ